MDAANPSAIPTFASRTPLHIGAVALKVRDLDRLTAYYHDAIGLAVLDRSKGGATLGAGGVPLLHLEHAPAAKPDDTRTAGLYHTAFLVPTRADLARWLLNAAQKRVPLTGASDHAVSEAIYLDDPEGNGIEVYRDRRPEEWEWQGDQVKMTTNALDLDDLVSAAGNETWPARPTACASATCIYASAMSNRQRRSIATRSGLMSSPPRRRDVHVVGALPSSRRRQCLAQRRSGQARRRSRGARLVRV